MTAPRASVQISPGAKDALKQMSSAAGVSQREFLEILLNYAMSCYRRPGSWEGSSPFHPSTYLDQPSYADRWF